MKSACRFDPETGAPLSRDTEYHPDYGPGVKVRTPVEHPDAVDWHIGREGALTNGELRSSDRGLLGYFRRVHRLVRTPNPDLDRAAALAIKRLKASNTHELDCFLWYALAERLAAKGYWVAWMVDFAVPRCPHCASQLKFRPGVDHLEAMCASQPTTHGAVDDDIHDRVTAIYESAFDDALPAPRIL